MVGVMADTRGQKKMSSLVLFMIHELPTSSAEKQQLFETSDVFAFRGS